MVVGQKIISFPDLFTKEKNEIEKRIRAYWFNGRQNEKGEKIESNENLAFLYIQLESLAAYVEKLHNDLGDKILAKMEEEGTNEILLAQYDRKISFDEEAKWIFLDNLSTNDWLNKTEKDNAEYLASLKKPVD